MTSNKEFADCLVHLRKQRNLGLVDLATKAGISKGLLCNIESGYGNPTLVTINRLAKALETTFTIGVTKPTRRKGGK